MAEPAKDLELADRPDVSHLITEDDTPVDTWFQERQQRLLTDSLYTSWGQAGQERPFLAAADVGLFYKVANPALVPDVMVSLDVVPPENWWEKHNRCYMTWEFGKAPELVVEIVSNNSGGQEAKLQEYARASVSWYAIFDPRLHLSKRLLRVYELRAGRYAELLDPMRLEGLQLGLAPWEGTFEGLTTTWLRCHDQDGNLLLTGRERAEQERERAQQERGRAERALAENERLREKLRELGIEPDQDR
jgi:Uma2 family endonuclease